MESVSASDDLRVGKDGFDDRLASSVADIDGDGIPDLVAFSGARSGLIGDEDVATAAAELEPSSTAVLLVRSLLRPALVLTVLHAIGRPRNDGGPGRLTRRGRAPAQTSPIMTYRIATCGAV